MWRAYLVQTTTGRVSAELWLDGDPTVSIELNGIESISVPTRMDFFSRNGTWWVRPYSASLLVTYENLYGEEVPVAAGPIIAFPTISPSVVKIEAKGIRHIFEKRYVIRGGEVKGQKTISFTNHSYGTIAQEVVSISMDRPNGALPIRFASPRETTGRVRNYEPWNVANLKTHDVLAKLTEVINGPAIMFRPEWVDEVSKTNIRWAMYHGTHDVPWIHQEGTPDIDLTADSMQILDFSAQSSGTNLVHRAIATGAGEGEGTTIVEAEMTGMVQAGMPWLEEQFSDSQQEDAQMDLLRRYAREKVRAGQRMVDQLSVKMPIDTAKNPLGTWNVGDLMTVTTPEMLFIPARTHRLRCIAASFSGGTVDLEFQEFETV